MALVGGGDAGVHDFRSESVSRCDEDAGDKEVLEVEVVCDV